MVTEMLLLAIAGLAGFMVLGLLMGIGLLPDPAEHPWAGVVGGPILMASAAAAYWGIERMMSRREPPAGPLVVEAERMSWSATLGVVLLHVGAAVVGSMVLGAIQELAFEQQVTEQDAIVDLVVTGDPLLLGLLAVVAVVLAPLTEEALFRGLFFRRLMTHASVSAAWILPALLFAGAHWNPVGLAIYVWLGLVFAHAYSRTGRLAAAVLTHAGANAITLSLLLFAPPPEVEAAQGEAQSEALAATEHADDAP
ncbi:CPBP family intramembrane glutamic endopeptidase [Nannocystaceae bacterium ST9]